MRQISQEAITAFDNARLPANLSINCGRCGSRDFFRPGTWGSQGDCRYAFAMCPSCRAHNFFFVVNYRDGSKPLGGGELFSHPSRPDWSASSDLLATLGAENKEIQRDYEQAIGYFNQRDAAAVVLASRRMLEGLTVQFLPSDKFKGNLATDLAMMNKERDLSPVLNDLSITLKDAGNMGAHYRASRVTQEIAEKSLSLVEDLLRLHFLLKSRVDDLKNLVEVTKQSSQA